MQWINKWWCGQCVTFMWCDSTRTIEIRAPQHFSGRDVNDLLWQAHVWLGQLHTRQGYTMSLKFEMLRDYNRAMDLLTQ